MNTVAVNALGNRAVAGFKDGMVKVWNLNDYSVLYNFHGHEGPVMEVKITPNGKWSVSRSREVIKVWDLENGDRGAVFICDHPTTSCAITPDGKTVLAVDISGQLHWLGVEGV